MVTIMLGLIGGLFPDTHGQRLKHAEKLDIDRMLFS